MPGRILSLNVVGVAHLNKNGSNRRFEIMLCNPGDPIELRPEPKNPVDPQAVAVFTVRGTQIGYLTAERAPWVGSMLKNGTGVVAIFQREAPWGAVIRIATEGLFPDLPPERESPEPEEPTPGVDFWPDEIPPDD